jgi:(p)ppGpp synthase/HD superfamily hydrolase
LSSRCFHSPASFTHLHLHSAHNIPLCISSGLTNFYASRNYLNASYFNSFQGLEFVKKGSLAGDYLAITTDANEILAALLHDVTELFPEEWPNSRISKEYGREVAYLVDIMTKPPGFDDETEKAREARIDRYHDRFKTAKKAAVRLKMADWMHNILTLIYCTPEKQQRKWFEACRHALPRALEHGVLYEELRTALYSPKRD